MSEVTSPILLDSTGQTTNTKLDAINTTLGQIKNVITTPSDAEDISYDNTSSGMTATNVQDAIDETNASLVNLIIVKTFTKSYSVGAKSGYNWNPTSDSDWNEDGYTPVGIMSQSTGNANVYYVNAKPLNQSDAMYIYNTSSSSQSGNARFDVLYIRN